MEKLIYKRLTKRDIDPAVKCIVKVFLYDEPMTKNLEISEKEFEVFVRIVCEKMTKKNLSYICKGSSNEVIGFCLNEDLITPTPKEMENVTKKMESIFELLSQLDKRYIKDKNLEEDTFFHLFMIGVLKKYRNQGIVQKLILKSIELAKLKGFKRILTEATSFKSQKLFSQKFGFNMLFSLNYKRFTYNGLKVFENIGEKSCKLLELKI